MENVKENSVVCEDERQEQQDDKVKTLLDGLAAGECKGIKGATAYKIAEYAQQKGLV